MIGWLLDTNVIAELISPKGEQGCWKTALGAIILKASTILQETELDHGSNG